MTFSVERTMGGTAIALVAMAACGNPPTQEEFYAQYYRYDQAGQANGACKISPPSGKGPTCDDCRNKNCCAAYKACVRDPSCSAVLACSVDCSKALDPKTPDPRQYATCVDACYRETPLGAAPYAAASTCLDGCKASCL